MCSSLTSVVEACRGKGVGNEATVCTTDGKVNKSLEASLCVNQVLDIILIGTQYMFFMDECQEWIQKEQWD